MNRILEIPDSATALVSTEGRYRVMIHRQDGTQEIARELQSIQSALAFVQSYNASWRCGHTWAEIIDYERAFDQQERASYLEDVEEAVERRLAAIEAEKPQPKRLGRLLVRAAAMIW
jgi:hypothetical protein